MIRRMEARISSIEGSCAFAVCVIRSTIPTRCLRFAQRRLSRRESLSCTVYTPEEYRFGRWKTQSAQSTVDMRTEVALGCAPLASVGGAHDGPDIPHLPVVPIGVRERPPKTRHLRRTPPTRRSPAEA